MCRFLVGELVYAKELAYAAEYIGYIKSGCFAATVMALIFAHTDLYVKDDDNNNEEKSTQEGE